MGIPLEYSVISNVVNRKPDTPVLNVVRENGMENVITFGLVEA